MQFLKKKSIKMVDQIQHCPLMATIINYTKYQYLVQYTVQYKYYKAW